MKARYDGTPAARRSRLLAALAAFLLVALPTAAVHAGRATAADRHDTITAAAAAVTTVARTGSDRLSSAHRLAPHRDLAGAALPAAVLAVFLLAVRDVGRRRVAGRAQLRLLTAPGRGPPVTS